MTDSRREVIARAVESQCKMLPGVGAPVLVNGTHGVVSAVLVALGEEPEEYVQRGYLIPLGPREWEWSAVRCKDTVGRKPDGTWIYKDNSRPVFVKRGAS